MQSVQKHYLSQGAFSVIIIFAVPGGDVILVFDRSRGLVPVATRLKDFSGTIQTDAYEVYESLRRQQPRLQRVGCLAHARRRFYAALLEGSNEAAWFISRIALLFRIEEKSRQLPFQERRGLRLQQAPAIWEELKTTAEALKPTVLPKSTFGKAISYLLNEYDALIAYLREGRFEIDNNLVENAIRPMVVGRKRWLFIGHSTRQETAFGRPTLELSGAGAVRCSGLFAAAWFTTIS